MSGTFSTLRARGVTLIEVLFAIAIVLVGVLGVAALVPVGLHHWQRGNIADRASVLAVRALHDVRVYGMTNPANWRMANGAPVYNPTSTKPFVSTGRNLDYFGLPNTALVSGAYMLDPQFVAMNGASGNPPFNASVFPYYQQSVANEPRLTRITAVPYDISLSKTTVSSRNRLVRGHADLIFQLQDELVVELPDDLTLPPYNRFESAYPGADNQWGDAGTDDDSNGVTDDPSEALAFGTDDFAARRRTESNFSWMAMFAPKRDRIGNFRDEYVLSIIVFHQRDPTMRSFEDANGNGSYDVGETVFGNERLVNVIGFPGAAAGQAITLGEVLLEARSASASPFDDLAVKTGDWLLLSGSATGATANDAVTDFQWYRVADADEIDETFNPPRRLVTLQGPDWRIFAPAPNTLVQATLMPRIVAVFEETIRLEYPATGG